MSTTIAINCILDYVILFPENSEPPLDYHINVSLINLAFNGNVATLSEDITCTLPDNLKSQYRVTGVFLDEECTTPLTTGTQIRTEDLVDTDTMNGVILDGTLIVYTKVEVIKKYLITWKYKTSTNEEIEKVIEVLENSIPIPPSFPLTFIVNENNIPYIYSFVSWTPTINEATVNCTYEATYNTTEYKTNVPYLINNISLFENAVPYYYGSGSPYYNYYLPLGEDDKVEVPENDIKVQMYTGDSYMVGESIEGFKINDYAITYIKKGTFPKLGEKSLIWDTGEEGLNKADKENDITNCVFKGYYNSDKKLYKLELIDLRYNPNSPNEENLTGIFHEKYPDEFDENELPTRLGFLLVAGGGGGGGVSFFTANCCETNKDNSSKDVTVPGAGGGGGAITMGVFNFDYPILTNYSYLDSTNTYNDGIAVGGYSLWTTDSEHKRLTGTITEEFKKSFQITSVEFHITGGIGGDGNGGGDKRGGNDEDTKDGKEGYDANIHIIINAEDSNGTKYYTVEPEKLPPKILKVCGGFGGQRGDYSKNEIAAGAGGIIYDNKSSSQLFYLASYPGGSGASVIIQSETGTAGPLSEYNKSLYLPLDIPPANYRIDINHSGVNPGGTADSTAWTACIFGGHSLGKGGIGEGGAPTKGGGGCSLKTTAGNGKDKFEAKNESAINEPTNGANGYFGIYY